MSLHRRLGARAHLKLNVSSGGGQLWWEVRITPVLRDVDAVDDAKRSPPPPSRLRLSLTGTSVLSGGCVRIALPKRLAMGGAENERHGSTVGPGR